MPWKWLKNWREVLEFFKVSSDVFAKITAVAVALFLIMAIGLVVLYIDRGNQIDRYEKRILYKDSIISIKDAKIEDLNKDLRTAKSDGENNFMQNFEKNVNTMQRVMEAREKAQDRQILELEKIKKSKL